MPSCSGGQTVARAPMSWKTIRSWVRASDSERSPTAPNMTGRLWRSVPTDGAPVRLPDVAVPPHHWSGRSSPAPLQQGEIGRLRPSRAGLRHSLDNIASYPPLWKRKKPRVPEGLRLRGPHAFDRHGLKARSASRIIPQDCPPIQLAAEPACEQSSLPEGAHRPDAMRRMGPSSASLVRTARPL